MKYSSFSFLIISTLYHAATSVVLGENTIAPSTIPDIKTIKTVDLNLVGTEASTIKGPKKSTYFQKRAIVAMSPKEKSDRYLKWFVGNLKNYISPIEFRHAAFLKNVDELKDEMDLILHFMKSVEDPEIREQLVFSRTMFDVIYKSAKLMRGLRDVESRGEYWMYRLVDLRARLLSLFNSHGQPDTDMKWLSNRIGVLYTEYATFKSLAEGEMQMDPETLKVVKIQIDEIGPLFGKLLNHLPH